MENKNNLTTDHNKIESWFHRLETDGILTKSIRNDWSHYHLNSPVRFIYPKKQISELPEGYHATQEKGGYILFQPNSQNGDLTLTAIDIKWIDNISENSENSYTMQRFS